MVAQTDPELADRPTFGPPLEPNPKPPLDVLAVLRRTMLGWDDASPAVRLSFLQGTLLNLADRGDLLDQAGRGDMYVGFLSDPPIETLTDAAGALLPVPDGYTRVGVCTHKPDAMQQFAGELQVSVTLAETNPLARVLVRSTLADAGGQIFVGTYLPRVRINWPKRNRSIEVFAYHDHDVRFTWKAMWGGPGWLRLMAEIGVDLGAE